MAPGFAHGFCVLSDWVDLHYKVSHPYNPSDEGGVLWNDPDIDIKWPLPESQLNVSERDRNYQLLSEIEL